MDMPKKAPEAETPASVENAVARKRGRPKGSLKAKSARSAKPGRPKAAKSGKAAGKPGRKKGNTGKRYGEEEKAKIIEYVKSQGRGGISKACKKYKVSYIALSRWLKSGGVKAGNAKSSGRSEASDARLAAKIKKAVAAAKDLRKQVTALHKLLGGLG